MKYHTAAGICTTFVVIFVFSLGGTYAGTGCPAADEIRPCTCVAKNFPKLICVNITNAEVLKSVYWNTKRYYFEEVHIEDSNFQYLPKDMFSRTKMRVLYLKKVTLLQLFDSTPDELLDLRFLYIESTRVLSGMQWDLFKSLKRMQFLSINYASIKTLTTQFSENVPKGLNHLIFHVTETKKIKPGTLVDFKSLVNLVFYKCRLTELTRDIFPRPFNIKFMYFDENRISTIPEDLFADMPKLQIVSMTYNLISVIPESAFAGVNVPNIGSFKFDNNPLTCDCLLVWLIRRKPEDLGGTCESPPVLKGRRLRNLSNSDFNC